MATKKLSPSICADCKGVIPVNHRSIRRHFCKACEVNRNRKSSRKYYFDKKERERKDRTFFHWTKREFIESIQKKGLKPNQMGFSYLTKFPKKWKGLNPDGVLLSVTVPKGIRLSCFEENTDGTEVLCWGKIPKGNILIIYTMRENNDKTNQTNSY